MLGTAADARRERGSVTTVLTSTSMDERVGQLTEGHPGSLEDSRELRRCFVAYRIRLDACAARSPGELEAPPSCIATAPGSKTTSFRPIAQPPGKIRVLRVHEEPLVKAV